MNVIAWKLFVAEHRDAFGIHPRPRQALAGLLHRVGAFLNRVSGVLRRRVTLEQTVWLLIAALAIGFILVLVIVGGHGGTGR
ncbi:MAG: hypothetical protein HYV20_13035 [Gemmatimonadetes bacterium]|nr:hypothetical protein [Gemmatimonadota bacterium]